MAEIQEIIRLAGTDVDGTKRIADALRDVSGIGASVANALVTNLDMDPETRIGSLGEDEIATIEELIKDPDAAGIPAWIRNRRKDRETGEDRHLIEADLTMAQEFDIRRMKEIKSYKGRRHEMGLPVRGQKTQSSFRSGEKVGVRRERIREEAEEEEEE